MGCLEAMGSIVYAFMALIPIGSCLSFIFKSDPIYEPLYWFFAYATVMLLEFSGRKFYFRFIRAYAFVIMSLIVFFLIITAQTVNTSSVPPSNQLFEKGVKELMQILPTVGWFYLGLEIIPLISDEVKEVRIFKAL